MISHVRSSAASTRGRAARRMPETITKVHSAPDVYLIHVPFENISTSATNCYVVRDGVHAAVIDTGAPTNTGAAVLSAALDELGIDRTCAKWFVTHFHLDHAGLIDRVVPEGAEVFASAAEIEFARASRSGTFLRSLQKTYLEQGIPGHDASAAARLGVEPELFDPERVRLGALHDGDVVQVGRYSLRAVATPGHTPGHMSLFEPQSGLLFGGDHALFVISPSIALFPHGADGLQAYLDSLRKVQDLGISQLLHSHGPIREDHEARLTWLGQHHLERLEEAREAIAAVPGITGYDAIRALTWNVPHDSWDDISLMQRWCIVTEGIVYLKHLIARGVVAADFDSDGILRYRAL